MCEPWPQSMCDVLASEVDPSRAKIMKESVLEYEQTVSSASLSQSAKTSKPMALKDLTNLPSRTQSTGSNPESCNDGQMPTVYEPSGVKVLICNEMVDLPRFSVTVENSLHIEGRNRSYFIPLISFPKIRFEFKRWVLSNTAQSLLGIGRIPMADEYWCANFEWL